MGTGSSPPEPDGDAEPRTGIIPPRSVAHPGGARIRVRSELSGRLDGRVATAGGFPQVGERGGQRRRRRRISCGSTPTLASWRYRWTAHAGSAGARRSRRAHPRSPSPSPVRDQPTAPVSATPYGRPPAARVSKCVCMRQGIAHRAAKRVADPRATRRRPTPGSELKDRTDDLPGRAARTNGPAPAGRRVASPRAGALQPQPARGRPRQGRGASASGCYRRARRAPGGPPPVLPLAIRGPF